MKITHNSKVTAAVDTGLLYWYKFKHGIGPGTMPKGVNVLKALDDGWKDYVLLDRMLTTEELNEYEIKEENPPQELLEAAGYSSIEDTYKEFNSCESIKGASDVNLIPEPFDKYYEVDDIDEESAAEALDGYEARHLAWLKGRDEYFDMLADNGIEYVELITEGGSDPFLAYAVHDRLYPVTEEDLKMAGIFNEFEDNFDEDFEDIEESSSVNCTEKIEGSWDNPNIFDFYGWYNNLSLKQRNKVDDWCDEWGYPLYDDCSRSDLAAIHDHFESEFAQSDETNFHVSSYGNDFNELYETFDTSDPKAAITKWMQLQQKFPLDVMITGYAKGEQILRDYVVAHPDWIRELCKKYKCPYDPEYLIAESEKPSRMKPSEYTDQLHPFGLG